MDLGKVCRICLSEGTRDIFSPAGSNCNQGVSSVSRIAEKLRFVTMLKVAESECMPGSICDSCIVQLNVAYTFKMKAVESDIKMRQYVIERGLGINDTAFHHLSDATTCRSHDFGTPQSLSDFPAPSRQQQRPAISHFQETTTIHAQNYARAMETPQSIVTEAGTASTAPKTFRCMPIRVKIEPPEFSEYGGINDVSPSTSSDKPHTVSDTSSVQGEQSTVRAAMVQVNGACVQPNPQTDKDYVSAYIKDPDPVPTTTTTTTSAAPTHSTPKKRKSDRKPAEAEKLEPPPKRPLHSKEPKKKDEVATPEKSPPKRTLHSKEPNKKDEVAPPEKSAPIHPLRSKEPTKKDEVAPLEKSKPKRGRPLKEKPEEAKKKKPEEAKKDSPPKRERKSRQVVLPVKDSGRMTRTRAKAEKRSKRS